jgi:Zn-dependent peptidase ImmA (M78 family)
MELLDLYSFTERNNIKIMSYNLETLNAVTIKLDKYFIGINKNIIKSEKAEKLILAHEIGHCMTDHFYFLKDINNPLYKQNIEKAEREADDYAISLLVSPEEIMQAQNKFNNDAEIAEELNISITLLRKAVGYYKRKNLL